MAIARNFVVRTAEDTFKVRVHDDSGKYYAEFQGTKPLHASIIRIGTPVYREQTQREQAIAHLISDCINKIIAMAGPITYIHIEDI